MRALHLKLFTVPSNLMTFYEFIKPGPRMKKDRGLDERERARQRTALVKGRPFLRRIYEEWYRDISSSLPPGAEPVLELGSGGGFLSRFIPGLITSEVFFCDDIRLVLDGCTLPFSGNSLRAVVMTNVLHHLPEPRRFFKEASRCVRRGGRLIMVEPWVTAWSSFVYSKLHHEPFYPRGAGWEYPAGGPLSGANSALPWIIFHRDRARFQQEFPEWRVHSLIPAMPFRYLLSGGVSHPGLMPGWSFTLWRHVERMLHPWFRSLAMFARIVLVRS